MTKAFIAGAALAVVIVVLVLAYGRRATDDDAPLAASPVAAPSGVSPTAAPGFLYGRVTTVNGATYEGRLRFGGGQEAFWSDTFNGVKHENPWIAHVPPERRPKRRESLEVFGLKLGTRDRPLDLTRPFTVPFGEIARLEATGDTVRVTLKSASVLEVNRFDASDFDDGVHVWDESRGEVELDSLRIAMIELLPTPPLRDAPSRLHGTVRTKRGTFKGFFAWNRDNVVGTDLLLGRTPEGELRVRLDRVRSIVPGIGDGARVTLTDGHEIEAFGVKGDRGLYVDDPRFGRVLISWGAFESLDFDRDDSGPAYEDFPRERPLHGSVATKDGRHLAGRLVFDLDENATTDTLDAPREGVDYAVPFGLIASIVPPGRVTLHGGDELELEPTGDLGPTNAGMLVFGDGTSSPAYVPWSEVERVELDRR